MHEKTRARAAAAGTAGVSLTRRQAARILARFYDLDVLDVAYDAELYLHLAREAGGAVLELAVGTGRLAVPLALGGHRVVGVDHDVAMLERARARWDAVRGPIERDRITLHEADLAAFRSEVRFGMAFLAVNTFLLAPDGGARLRVLGAMREQLRPGGLAVVEVSTPDEEELATFDGRLQLEWLREDPESGDSVAKLVSARHDPDSERMTLHQVFEWTSRFGGPLQRVTRTDHLHLISAERLVRLAHEAGFAKVDLWGDHLSIPHGPGSHRAILVARLL